MQDGPLFKFETWAPDLSSIDTNVTGVLENVYPRADGYGPIPSWQQLTQSLPSACRGGVFARNPVDGSVSIFAGTINDLWQLNNTTLQWQCVSKQPYGGIASGTISNPGTGYTDGTYIVGLIGGSHGGGGATATVVVSGGVVTSVSFVGLSPGTGYVIGDVLTAPQGALGVGGSGFQYTVGITNGLAQGTIFGGSVGAYTTDGVYTGVPLSGGTHGGAGAIGTIQVQGGIVIFVSITSLGNRGYQSGDVLTNTGNFGAGAPVGLPFTYTLTVIQPLVPGGTALDAYTALAPTDNWQFVQFNSLVVAVQENTQPQKFTLGSANQYFADLGGTNPQAAGSVIQPGHIAVINQFLVLSGMFGFPFRVQWCDFAQPEVWAPGFGLANLQDMPDGGVTHDVRGTDQYGILFQDASIRMLSLSFGSPFVFQILRISSLDGIFGQYSSVNTGDKVFFCSPQGFKKIETGGAITPIGKEKVDRTFFADLDQGNLQLFVASTDPKSTRVYWMYKSMGGQLGLADTVLVYDWALDRWTQIVDQQLEYLLYLTKPAQTLEGLDALAPYAPPGASPVTPPAITAAADNGSGGTRLTMTALNSYTGLSPPNVLDDGSYNLYSGVGAGTIVGGSGYTNGTYHRIPLINLGINQNGVGASATITVAGHAVTAVTFDTVHSHDTCGTYYEIGDVLGVAPSTRLTPYIGPGSGFTFTVTGPGQSQNSIEFQEGSATGGLLTLITAEGNSFPFTVVDSTHIDIPVPFSALGSATGTASIGGSIDLPEVSLDSYSNSPLPQISAFAGPDPLHALGLFTGPNLQALLETPDQDLGERMAIYWLRPLTDTVSLDPTVPACQGAIGARDTAQLKVNYAAAPGVTNTDPTVQLVYNAITAQGLIPVRTETRYARASILIPAGTVWTYASGCKAPDTQPAQGDR